MKIRYMKAQALEYFKTNMPTLYTNYFTKEDNSWMTEAFGSDPFEDFREVNDFELADPQAYLAGELDLENCKIIYSNLRFLSESMAADERLWAGLCNDVFYDYMKIRWANYELKKADTDCSGILARYYFSGGVRSGLYGNTLSKCWWIGRATYDENNEDHFAKLDIIGSADFSTKVREIFYSNNFSANPTILNGILNAMKYFNDIPYKLIVKEHIRPALKYLNAVGGNVLLDALSTEEIEDLVRNKMIELVNGNDKTLDYESEENVSDPDEPEVEETEEETVEEAQADDEVLQKLNEGYHNQEDDARYVQYGDTFVVIRKKDEKEFTYTMPDSKENLNDVPTAARDALGKKVGESYRVLADLFKVVSIEE